MHLQREFLPRIEELGKNGKARRVRHAVAKDFGSMIAPQFVQGPAAPRSLPNDALGFGPIDDLPRFTNPFAGRQLFAENAL